MELEDIYKGIEGCGDHGCLIKRPVGMGTNGGCRCHGDRNKMRIILSRLLAYRAEREKKGPPDPPEPPPTRLMKEGANPKKKGG